jgi:hypothetical protein
MSKIAAVTILVGVLLAIWWYEEEKEAKVEQVRQERARLEARRLQQQDPLMRFVGCMANHASQLSQVSAARAISTLRSGKSIKGDDYAEFEKMRNSLMSECRGPYGSEVSAIYPNLSNEQFNEAFLRVMAEDPLVVNWLGVFDMISDVDRKAYVK